MQAAEDTGLDIAVEPAGLRRRAKRLVVLDVDSTLIRDEAIDVLAARAGRRRAGRRDHRAGDGGELDFEQSLRAGSRCWPGLPWPRSTAVRDATAS